VINVHLPALRERGADIMLIAQVLPGALCAGVRKSGQRLLAECVVALRKYRWPGNIRELENRLKKAIVSPRRPCRSATRPQDRRPAGHPAVARPRRSFSATIINEVLALNGGNRNQDRTRLGVDPRDHLRHLEKEDADGKAQGNVPQDVS